ncbi:MAG TPA: rhomboid family intramembrane serine protease [Candidatus Paceibacterota bacterium]|nr:rhomboid family intramembrane serine protease [Verrucomicrobiota bacterium]HRY51662.1 rhomboid family intramembrane serine protease [Candidatus Paceibacterota bacterium]HSA00046.1 rhomboid family intramembrane serine protease [Candidatus Paceibacterota bacterium]
MASRGQIKTRDAVEISSMVVAGLFAIHLARTILRISAVPYGIVPRTGNGLVGILLSPLLHANWAHVLANALPLFLFLTLLLTNQRYYPSRALAMIWLASGLGTWLIGRSGSVHIGASGIVFGLAAYLIASGFLMKCWKAALVAVVIVLLFGGMFYGVLPQAGPISWEGHLCGALGGVWAARQNHR